MASGGGARPSQPAPPLALESLVPSLFRAQAAPLLFLSHLTTTDSHIVVAPLQAGHG